MNQRPPSPLRPPQPFPKRIPLFGRLEARVLVGLLVLSGLLLGFVFVAGEVTDGDTHGFDRDILLALRTPGDIHDPIGPFWVEAIFRDITALGGYTVLSLILGAALMYLLIDGKRLLALLMFGSVVGGFVISNILKLLFDRQRPDIVGHLVDVHSLSFPSGHAMLSAVTYLTLGAILARSEKRFLMRAYFVGVAVFLTLLIGASRVYLGVHYPTDVLAGWCAGAAWALVCLFAVRRLQHRGDVEPSS